MESKPTAYGHLWGRIYDLCSVLRGDNGCAWDRAQTSESLAPYLVEEVHELLEALALGDRDRLTEEAGDTFYLWVLLLQVLEQEGRLRLEEAVARVEEKLTRRHPHVFAADGAQVEHEAPGRWEQRKREELPREDGILQPLPATMPALIKARRLQERAAAFGFDWDSPEQVVDKIREEINEFVAAHRENPESPNVREEFGDILFAIVNLARHLHQNPEGALARATEKFRRRFNTMAHSVEDAGFRMGEAPMDVLEAHWQAAKPTARGSDAPADRQRE